MLFMILFWIVLFLILIIYIINFSFRSKKLDKFIGFLIVIQFLVFIVTLVTKDPIFEAIGLPKEYEWIGGLLASGFLLWAYYLGPLKERIIKTERRVEGIDTKINEIKDDVLWIKNNCNISFKK